MYQNYNLKCITLVSIFKNYFNNKYAILNFLLCNISVKYVIILFFILKNIIKAIKSILNIELTQTLLFVKQYNKK
jgi:hypothetical protein